MIQPCLPVCREPQQPAEKGFGTPGVDGKPSSSDTKHGNNLLGSSGHQEDLLALPLGPFADPQQQGLPLSTYPSLQSPLAIFSPAGSSRSSNTLIPAGSTATIKFGAFSPSKGQASILPSPRANLASPFAGAPLLTRNSSALSSQISSQTIASKGQATPARRAPRETPSAAIPVQRASNGRLSLAD